VESEMSVMTPHHPFGSKELHVIAINYDWEKTYYLDSLHNLKVGKIKEFIRYDDRAFSAHDQVLIYKGNTIPSDEIFLADIVGEDDEHVIEISMYLVSSGMLPAGCSYQFDPLSIEAAKEYFGENNESEEEEFMELEFERSSSFLHSIPSVHQQPGNPPSILRRRKQTLFSPVKRFARSFAEPSKSSVSTLFFPSIFML
jgi:hypothetical protein